MGLSKRQRALISEWAKKISPEYQVYFKVGRYLNTRETGRGFPIYLICESYDKEDKLTREIARCSESYTIEEKMAELEAELAEALAGSEGNRRGETGRQNHA